MENSLETEQDLQRLIGQFESIRLDFKASELLAQPKQRIIKQLAEDTSAFANTEGGAIVIGIREGKSGKKSVAIEIDGGIDPAEVSPEWLEQLIASNISPAIPGLTVQPIPLSGARMGRFAYVVNVPKGTTAYQARHSLLYYGRSEFAAIPLHDNEIRLRVARGRFGHASVSFRLCSVRPSTSREAELRQNHRTAIEAAKTDAAEAFRQYPELWDVALARFEPDVIEFELVIQNDGELTIREPAVQLSERRSETLINSWTIQGESLPSRLTMPSEIIYPGDQRSIAGSRRRFRCKRGAALTARDYIVDWQIFLDNSPPSYGEIDLGEHIQSSRTSKAYELSPTRL